jgi:pyruvate kinase
MNKTKIIATVGPGCDDESTLQALVELGVCCFRINLSHGSKDQKIKYFDTIRSLRTPLGLRPTILADLAGPKIRVKNLEKPLCIKQGDSIVLSNDQEGSGIISVSNGVRFEKVNPGAQILIDDGRVSLEVKNLASDQTLKCIALVDGVIENRKGVNFPGIALNVPVLTEQDEADLQISLSKEADWIALSFVRSPSDYDLVREKIRDAGHTTPIMGKIEKWEAVQNIDGIIDSFDAVMVARGDLGVETPIEKVPLVQKEVIEKANQAGKPVVIATQILDSMIDRPVPTRAEVSDIANAILDGADSLMVTGETAVGKHPKKVIGVLSRVIEETESSIDYEKHSNKFINKKLNTANAISHAACSVSGDQGIGVLVTMTHSGSTARMAARYRPAAKIVAMTPFKETCRRLAIVWGVNPLLVDNYKSADEIPEIANKVLRKKGLIEEGERFVITGGIPVGVPGTTNYLSVLKGN